MRDKLQRRSERRGKCLIWTGGATGEESGHYGAVYDPERRKNIGTHVAAWECAHGRAVPSGKCVRHTCDTPLCIEELHLVLGTQGDNIGDKVERNRQARGETIGVSKLTAAQVASIRHDKAQGMTYAQLAAKNNISRSSIFNIVSRRTWAHID